MDPKKVVDYDALQRQYVLKFEEHKKKQARYNEMSDRARKDNTILAPSYQGNVDAAGYALLGAERKFKDAINLLLVDCLEAVVANGAEAAEKFALLNQYGPLAGFTKAQGEAMSRITARTAKGGEK